MVKAVTAPSPTSPSPHVAVGQRGDLPVFVAADTMDTRLPLSRPAPPASLQLTIPWPVKDLGFQDQVAAAWRRMRVSTNLYAFRMTLLNRMLTSYGAGSGWTLEQREKALLALRDQLDFHNNGVAFRSDLRELARRDDVGEFMHALEQCLTESATTGERVPLFALAETYAGSPAEATRWLAVLLQDVRFRTATDDPWVGEVPTTLEPTFERVMALLSDDAIRSRVDAYPPGVDIRDSGFYHFYTPAYLTRKMIAAGVPADLAAATATVFNCEYELNQYAASRSSATTSVGRFVDEAGFALRGVSSGTGIENDSQQQIYAGYVGAMREAGAGPRSFSEMREALLKDPKAAMHAVVRDAHDRYSERARTAQ